MDTNSYGLPLHSQGTEPYYRGRFPPSNNGSHPLSRERSDCSELDFLGYANQRRPLSKTALSAERAIVFTSALHRTKAITNSAPPVEVFSSVTPSGKFPSSRGSLPVRLEATPSFQA